MYWVDKNKVGEGKFFGLVEPTECKDPLEFLQGGTTVLDKAEIRVNLARMEDSNETHYEGLMKKKHLMESEEKVAEEKK